MASYVGSNVTINCGSSIGHCQGVVKEVDQKNQTITLSSVFMNGVKWPHHEMTILSSDIKEITIIDRLLKPTGKNTKESLQLSRSVPSTTSSVDKGKRANDELRDNQSFNHSPRKPSNERQNVNGKGRKSLYKAEDDCFSADPKDMTEDFDFAKNLALFDKLAVYNEINSGSDGEMKTPSKQKSKWKPEEKFRHDENVLQKAPVVYRQIITNEMDKHDVVEYYTDSGLVVPTISNETHVQILHAAELMGFGTERQMEIFGAHASLMALTVLGGSNRLHPRNSHQPPSVVVMCGPHRTGAQGVATARHLSNHNVKVYVYLPNFVKIHECLQDELRLLSLTNASVLSEYSELPRHPVDMILSAIDEAESDFLCQQSWYQHAVRWCNENRAPLMALSPPIKSNLELHVKWTVCAGLPFSLSSSYGALYMIDIGIPVRAFEKVGIQYQSPFGGKSSLRLNRNS